MYIGDRTGPGRPRFDRKQRLWRVPVLCADGTRIGEVALDEALNFVEVHIEPAEREEVEAVPTGGSM
jgi:hypothetical protein